MRVVQKPLSNLSYLLLPEGGACRGPVGGFLLSAGDPAVRHGCRSGRISSRQQQAGAYCSENLRGPESHVRCQAHPDKATCAIAVRSGPPGLASEFQNHADEIRAAELGVGAGKAVGDTKASAQPSPALLGGSSLGREDLNGSGWESSTRRLWQPVNGLQTTPTRGCSLALIRHEGSRNIRTLIAPLASHANTSQRLQNTASTAAKCAVVENVDGAKVLTAPAIRVAQIGSRSNRLGCGENRANEIGPQPQEEVVPIPERQTLGRAANDC